MFGWVTRRVARRAAVIAMASTAFGGVVLQLALSLTGRTTVPWTTWSLLTLTGALAAFVITGWLVDAMIGSRLRRLVGFLEDQAKKPDDLRRLPPMGEDEVGRAAQATNELLAAMTTVRVSMIDQQMELTQTQERLRLESALAAKTGELDARLRERALLFELLRSTTAETVLDDVLRLLVQRLGPALRLRELAILICEPDPDQFVIRAVHGFDSPQTLLGRSIRPGEGIAGEVARAGAPVLVRDVESEPEYLAFWGEVAREGSFAAIPIRTGDKMVGIMVMTRPPDDPLSDQEMRFMTAVADTMVLAIRHAQMFEELREMSMHDELTGLANRRLLQARSMMEIERARRFGHPLAALMVDIDHFKKLNDREGHATGDEALREVARLLAEEVRRVDTVARFGGEEFVIILPESNAEAAAHVADKLRRAVAETDVPGGAAQPGGRLTISVGVAQLEPGDDASTLIERADEALYLAKERGRNRVAVVPAPRDSADERAS